VNGERAQSTIVALATAPGKGAIAIVRASGPAVDTIRRVMIAGAAQLRPRIATYVTVCDDTGRALDRALALYFPAPQSYTGEEMLELQLHGSPVVTRDVVLAMLACGARLAGPGEFTQRAFLNGKIGLREAAAIADLVDAQTSAAARAALANFGSALSREVVAMREAIAGFVTHLEASIDFPDEVPEPQRASLLQRLEPIRARLGQLRRDGEFGRLLREGLAVAIVGPPNAGKSSLLNALLGTERAIVSEVPGTTRDTIEESIAIDGVPVRLVDTAGIRAHAGRIEAEGMTRSIAALEAAALAVVVLDGSVDIDASGQDLLERTARRRRVVLLNKADIGVNLAMLETVPEAMVGSVRDAATIEGVRARIARAGWDAQPADLAHAQFSALHELEAISDAIAALDHALHALRRGEPTDFAAGELQSAFSALGHVSERAAAEEVVTRIFARFCIGK
jgi:tRNA modification GTPase